MALLRDILASQVLLFERPVRAPYDPATGRGLLLAFVLVGLVIQPGLRALAGLADPASWVRPAIVVTLLVAVILVMRGFVGSGLATIGLHPWKAWTPRERIYLLLVAPAAAVAFSLMFRARFEDLADAHGWAHVLLLSVPTGLLWGFVQELIYRGLLQTELVRRLGAVPGVLLANVVFTFGPLHFEYFRLGTGAGPDWSMFAAIFGIGLLFGLLYQRSGNLWIPAILHGLWPFNMT